MVVNERYKVEPNNQFGDQGQSRAGPTDAARIPRCKNVALPYIKHKVK